jgi:5-methylcytosine-specific restriction enzyme subunit McrC
MDAARIQVFEHQAIKIGDQIDGTIFSLSHFKALSLFAEQTPNKYYKLIHNGIRFSHYVGVLQIKGLTIEILPKVSQYDGVEKDFWQKALLEMLRQCRLLKVDSLSSAYLRLKPNAILDLYVGIFIEEVEQLLRRGLIKKYVRKQAKLNALKGRLLLAQQLRKQSTHQEVFFTEHGQYIYDHTLNRIIKAALDLLTSFPLSPQLVARLHRLIKGFPTVAPLHSRLGQYPSFSFDRMTSHYQVAVEIAHLLIGNYHPSLQPGSSSVLAILFDMNLLFEEFVYQQLIKIQNIDIKVARKVNRPFWGRSYLQPDIIMEYKGHRFILDTKWKELKGVSPSMQDLRQIYTYAKQFSARHGILIYPSSRGSKNMERKAFANPPEDLFPIDCQIISLEILKEGHLNTNLGKEIVSQIIGNEHTPSY